MLTQTARRRTALTGIASIGLVVLLAAGIWRNPSANGQTRPRAPLTTLDWPYYGNDLGGMRYQNVDQINTGNVARLKPAWVFHTGVLNSDQLSFESQPIIAGGTLYITSGEDHVFALNPATGALKWTYNPTLPALADMALCCGVDNRGVAVGGGKVFIGQLNATLVALNARDGKMLWKTTLAPYRQHYSETMAPQYVDGKVIIGISGGEFETRGRLSAYDANTGKELWRFYTVPGPGAFGHSTWAGASWRHGGAPIWSTPTVDTKLGLLYFATGNTSPDLNGSRRAGTNLFANTIIALELNTGKPRWYFQEVHHDIWDYDGPQMTQLYTVTRHGQRIPAIGHANKNGNYFMLDRRTGVPLFPVKEVAVPTTPAWQHPWPTQPMPATQPLEPQTVAMTPKGLASGPLWTVPRPRPTLIQPGAETGPEWPAGAFSPRTGYVYLPAGGYDPWFYRADPHTTSTSGSTLISVDTTAISSYGLFDAVNTATGKIAWRVKTRYKALSGMAVAGDLVFFGRSTGEFDALNARTGRVLWSYMADQPNMGGANGSPAVYARNGREYVVMAFGGNADQRAVYQTATALLGDALVAFALPAPGDKAPRVVSATPMLVDPGDPEMFPAATSAPPGAHVITISMHDFHFYPSRIIVRAGETVALHVKNTAIENEGFAVALPTGLIGVEGGVDPGKDVYFAFTAPRRPGSYEFYGPGDARYYGLSGRMIVRG